MPKRARKTKQELADLYDDVNLQARIIELLDLRSFLLQCIIHGNYKISDDLNNALTLSEYGDEFLRDVGRKGMPIKEGRLTCLLEFYHLDLLIDPENTPAAALAAAIGAELLSGNIQLPFVHGPELYERAAELFQDERSYLGVRDTLRLLEGTSIGVFQMGKWVSGPYGLLHSSQARSIRPTLRVPLQHCSDVSCRIVHTVHLTTDVKAPINDHRPDATRSLEQHSEEPSDFAGFFSDITKDPPDLFDDFNTATLPFLIGDCLADGELTSLLAWLLDNTKGEIRELTQDIGMSGSAHAWAETLSRAQSLQVILLATDKQILGGLDRLIFREEILVPGGEVRRPVLFRRLSAGAFGARPEMSSLGVRLNAGREIAPLRLRRLVDQMYKTSYEGELNSKGIQDAEELGWQLRGVSGLNLLSRLDEYLRTESPEVVLERLVLARRENVEMAASVLGLDVPDELDDATLISRLLWKLGFDMANTPSPHERFWVMQERMTQAARSASVSTIIDHETMRGLGANYFVALEELLADTLAFAAWVLTSDHTTDGHPFQYDTVGDRSSGLNALTEFAATAITDERTPPVYDESTTLFPLCEGFGFLGRYLESLVAEEWTRNPAEYPEFAGKTRLQEFPFVHTCAFLDLTPASQASVIAVLKEVSRELVSAEVADVRNEQLHFRRSTADLDRLVGCLSAVERAVQALDNAGLVRVLFHPDRRETDRWGRSTFYFSDRAGREIAFGRPTSFALLNLPELTSPQYLVTSAKFADPNEIIRVRLATDSAFQQLWSKFPLRREPSSRADDLGQDPREPSGQRVPQSIESR